MKLHLNLEKVSGLFSKTGQKSCFIQSLILPKAHKVRAISNANCKIGIGPPLKALKLIICTDWKHFAARNFVFEYEMCIV